MRSMNRFFAGGLALLCFLILLGLMTIPYRMISGGTTPSWDRSLTDDPVKTLTFSATTAYPDGSALVFIAPQGGALRVTVNGSPVFTRGNPDRPTGMFTNSMFAVALPNTAGAAEIAVQLFSTYVIGLRGAPVILSCDQALRAEWVHFILYSLQLAISIGAAVTVGVILIVVSRLPVPKRLASRFLGIAAVLVAVYALDYIPREIGDLLFAERLTRTVLMSLGYAATVLFVAGLESYYTSRVRATWFIAAPTAAGVLFMLLSPDLAFLWPKLPYLNLILVVNLAVSIVIILRREHESAVMLVPAILILAALLEMIIAQFLGIAGASLLKGVVLYSAVLFGAQLMREYWAVYRERELLESKYNRDPLTGAYNRHVLDQLSPRSDDVLAMIDLDGFKSFNDTYGHDAGDRFLQNFTRLLTDSLRHEDVVIRYGGDEFVIVARGASAQDMARIMDRVRGALPALSADGRVDMSYGINEGNLGKGWGLRDADELMYRMKNEHRQQRETEGDDA